MTQRAVLEQGSSVCDPDARMLRQGSLVAVASVLPDDVLTNRDLEEIVDTDDEWIKKRTGIEERRRGSTTVQLAIDAARATLAEADSDGEEVDLVIVATQTPDEVCPSTAARVQDALGLECGAFDLNSACSGWVYGVLTANGLLAGGMRSALVIGVDRMTKVTDYSDRSTAILFGDGAGAVLMRATDVPGAGILGFDVGTDGSKGEILGMELGGNVYMKGSELFKVMVRHAVGSCERALAMAGLEATDLKAVFAHQANQRILDAVSSRLGLDEAALPSIIAHTGNTSAASIPLTLDSELQKGRLEPDDLIMLLGFGGGLSWATAITRWAPQGQTVGTLG